MLPSSVVEKSVLEVSLESREVGVCPEMPLDEFRPLPSQLSTLVLAPLLN